MRRTTEPNPTGELLPAHSAAARRTPLTISLSLSAIAAILCAAASARADNLFVTFDSNNPTVEEYASAQISGSDTGNTFVNGGSSGLNQANGITIDASGNVYVANTNVNTITEYNSGGSLINTFNSASLDGPASLAFDQFGNLYVANGSDGEVLKYSASNIASGGAVTPSVFSSGLGSINGLAFDSEGNLYASDFGDSIVYKIPAAGGAPATFISPGDFTTIHEPRGLAFNSQGDLFVANSAINDIEEFSPLGVAMGVFATSGENVNNPDGIAFDSSGNLYVVNLSHDSAEGASYGYSSIEQSSASGTLLNTFNVDTNDATDGFNLKDGGYVAIENDSGVPLLLVPEPSNAALLLLGAGSLIGFSSVRRRRI